MLLSCSFIVLNASMTCFYDIISFNNILRVIGFHLRVLLCAPLIFSY